MPRMAVVVLAVAVSAIAAAPAQAQFITTPEVLPRLEAAEAANDGMAGPVTSTGLLHEGKSYIVRVRGIYGAFDSRLIRLQGPLALGWRFCGDRIGARGQDAELVWGMPITLDKQCPHLPFRHNNLLLDAGAGFAHETPADTLAVPTSLEPANRYEYLVTRTNGDGPVSAAIRDTTTIDNRGALRVRVRRLRVADCTSGGWTQFNGTFADEAACLARVP